MTRRIVAPLLLLFSLPALALAFQSHLSRAARRTIGSDGTARRPNHLFLRVGGDLPRLEVPAIDDPRRVVPPVEPRVEPPAPEARDTKLRAGESIWDLCVRVYGKGSRWRDVLEANSWTELQARRLRPGTLVKLPRRAARRGPSSSR